MGNNISRKHFISESIMAVASASLAGNSIGKNIFDKDVFTRNPTNRKGFESDKLKICIFSKNLQWLNYNDMASLAAEMGFDGIDLTVRPDGHVLPERVNEDLPKAVEAAQKAGLKIYTLTTNIQEANEKYAESIIKTAASLGIKHYRTGWYTYNETLDIPDNIDLIKNKFVGLEQINSQYGIYGDYQNHMGEYFGASIWDLWLALKDIKTDFIGCQFDIRHATVEGANTWIRGLQLLHSHIKTIAVKDFYWEKRNNKWQVKNISIGKGVVDFKRYFELVKKYNLPGPLSMHCEYPLGGAENGNKELTISKKQFVNIVQNDLATLKSLLQGASLI